MQIYVLGGAEPRGNNILLSMRDTPMRPSHRDTGHAANKNPALSGPGSAVSKGNLLLMVRS
jgi:hypothetical protein